MGCINVTSRNSSTKVRKFMIAPGANNALDGISNFDYPNKIEKNGPVH
jgi:hypothetical protein